MGLRSRVSRLGHSRRSNIFNNLLLICLQMASPGGNYGSAGSIQCGEAVCWGRECSCLPGDTRAGGHQGGPCNFRAVAPELWADFAGLRAGRVPWSRQGSSGDIASLGFPICKSYWDHLSCLGHLSQPEQWLGYGRSFALN